MDYRVLARKYRPTRFADLIGQEVLVRTLTNAITTGRLAHAYLLTGIRGIGKTTTARIIARALNCVGEDGNGGPTTSPCGVCANCKMIAEDRHVDVLEMDAASRTGVDGIRELIDTVNYLPTSARYKIYIIDEVHMLSNNAFNALLKTLEEPPPHVKFIFATTEVRKIPVTILSRCQRFDLKRVDVDTLKGHLADIITKENAEAEDEALKLISIAAEGSVRDALSMLDQAIAHGLSQEGSHKVTTGIVRDMLGLADKSQGFNVLEPLFAGNTQQALEIFKTLYNDGIDPLLLLGDLMELVHFITRIKLVPGLDDNLSYAETERARAAKLAEKLGVAELSRSWQMLIKGLNEARVAPNPFTAVEMVLVRLCHAAQLPTPADVIRTLQEEGSLTPKAQAAKTAPAPVAMAAPVSAPRSASNLALAPQNAPIASATAPRPMLQLAEPAPLAQVENFDDVVALFATRKEVILYSHLVNDTRLVQFDQGRIDINTIGKVPGDFVARLGRLLSQWTGQSWQVNLSQQAGQASIAEQQEMIKQEQLNKAAQHPTVQSVMEHFPGAVIQAVK